RMTKDWHYVTQSRIMAIVPICKRTVRGLGRPNISNKYADESNYDHRDESICNGCDRGARFSVGHGDLVASPWLRPSRTARANTNGYSTGHSKFRFEAARCHEVHVAVPTVA